MIVGIDLGTTNSLVAVWQDGKSHIVPNALGHNLTPSVVSVDDGGGNLVGLAARDRLLTHPSSAVATLNRDVSIGRDTSGALKPIFNEQEIQAGVCGKKR